MLRLCLGLAVSIYLAAAIELLLIAAGTTVPGALLHYSSPKLHHFFDQRGTNARRSCIRSTVTDPRIVIQARCCSLPGSDSQIFPFILVDPTLELFYRTMCSI